MTTIIFATTNKRKIQEANESLMPYGLTVEPRAVDIDEIQHHNPVEITKAKAKSAYEAIGQPVVVQDTSWNIPALGGFPGGYMKDVAGWWKPEDWMKIMDGREDRAIICLEHVVYFDGENLHHFEAQYAGQFVTEPRGINGDSLDKSVITAKDSEKTLAEMHDEGKVASSHTILTHWEDFAKWYVASAK